MNDQIEEIKQKVNIVGIVSDHVVLKKKGRNLVGLCPFHSEKTGSFMVSEELQIYKCFGCGAGGDVIKFLIEVEGLSFGEALEKLADKAGVRLVKKLAGDGDRKRELIEVHDLAMEYYHYLLTKHPLGEEARKYLTGRGLNEKLWKTFKLGYALPEWDGLTKYLVGKKGKRSELLVAAGLAAESSGRIYDRFRGRIVFPLLDIAGRVVGFSGRILPELAKAEDAKYINSPETEIYHKSKMLYGLTMARSEIKKKNRVVIVEGELDMISSFAAGVTETVAIKGSALTNEMMSVLSRLTRTFVLALDADLAGEAAMKRSIEDAERLDLSIKMVEIVGGKDPDEIARKKPKEWREMVDKAVPVYEFFFAKSINRWGTDSVENIGKIVKEIVPYLAKIENSVIREVWTEKLAKKLGVNKQRVWEEIEKIKVGRPTTEASLLKVGNNDEAKQDLELQVISFLLFAKQDMLDRLKIILSDLPISGAVAKLIAMMWENGELKEVENFIRSLPEELQGLAQEGYLYSNGEIADEKEVIRMTSEWAKRMIKEEIARLTEKIKEAENGNRNADVGILSEKLVKLTHWKDV